VVHGLNTLDLDFIEDRIRLGAGPPLQIDDLHARIHSALNRSAIDWCGARPGSSMIGRR
jgi:hypothetical protein